APAGIPSPTPTSSIRKMSRVCAHLSGRQRHLPQRCPTARRVRPVVDRCGACERLGAPLRSRRPHRTPLAMDRSSMALSSMTGFARGHGVAGPYAWAWELKSVNAKGLDLRLRLPPGWDAVEVP